MGGSSSARRRPAAILTRKLFEERDVIQPGLLIHADTAAHIGSSYTGKVGQVKAPREPPRDELR